MRIRRTVLGLGIFFFGVGIVLSGAVAGYSTLSFSVTATPWSLLVDALLSFLIAAVLLAWSLKD